LSSALVSFLRVVRLQSLSLSATSTSGNAEYLYIWVKWSQNPASFDAAFCGLCTRARPRPPATNTALKFGQHPRGPFGISRAPPPPPTPPLLPTRTCFFSFEVIFCSKSRLSGLCPETTSTGPNAYKGTRPLRVRMASPSPPLSILLGDTLNPGTNPQPWQSCVPVARSAGRNRRPDRSRSCSADSTNVHGQQRPSTLTVLNHISPAHGDVGLSTSPFRSIAVVFLALAKANKDRVRFCQKVYESNHFSSPDPIRVCIDDLYCEAVQTFLDWSCSVSNFKSSSSLFTYSKGWRMGVVQHTGFPVNPVIKIRLGNDSR
jgi:hypothetical protein